MAWFLSRRPAAHPSQTGAPSLVRRLAVLGIAGWGLTGNPAFAEETSDPDLARRLQTEAIAQGHVPWGHWGYKPEKYTQWNSHSNRLIPIYIFGTKGAGAGVDLESYTGKNSVYRNEKGIRRLYGRLPENTLNPNAQYCDQTNIYDLQRAASKAGKKHIILFIFDGMDWFTTRNASIYYTKQVGYRDGRGAGLHMQDYQAGGTTQFGFMCTSPHNSGTEVDVNLQRVLNPGGKLRGGYDPLLGGDFPWSIETDGKYPIGASSHARSHHAYTDSSSSASSMTAGIKLYNNAINVDPEGVPVPTIAHQLQEEGWAVGAVTSVPICHATPACTYSHNVDRDDYQDLSRDQLGLPSISHPKEPLPGLDLLIGGGFGTEKKKDDAQGANFVPGNAYLTNSDRQKIDVKNGGKYIVAERTKGVPGRESLMKGVNDAIKGKHRLLGFYGVGGNSGHLPFETADGDYRPAPGRSETAERYRQSDITENPLLSDMAGAALTYMSAQQKPFWLMIEAGDVDWANHDNNIDNSIGAVHAGDRAVRAVTDWVEKNSNWDDTLLIVTADHGHFFHLLQPEVLVRTENGNNSQAPQATAEPAAGTPKSNENVTIPTR